MFQRFTAGVVAVVLSTAMAAAQTLTVPQNINVGDTVSIGYSDPGRAGQTITVTVDLRLPEIVVTEIYIHLDQSGNGSVTWTAPEGFGVAFNAPGVREIARVF